MSDVVIASAVRTPVGSFNGTLSSVSASYLGSVAIREAMTGTTFPTYKAAYERWFGTSPSEPTIGFPAELR